MINPKELRIGDKIIECGFDYHSDGSKFLDRTDDEIITVDADVIKGCINNPGHYVGIPLTPEWLERMDFKADNEKVYPLHLPSGFMLGLKPSENNSLSVVIGLDYWDEFGTTLLYVHQLQNLYFALTSEELEIKDP